MTGGVAPGCGPATLKPLFRCKVLKPPRYLVSPQERVVTHPPIDVVAGVIRRDDGRLLITQRLADDTLGGYWEFPGGKVDPGEELKAALHRELMEELGVDRSRVKPVLAWLGEKVGRLKPNGQLRGYSPLSRVVELETLVLGITGKLRLWLLLDRLLDGETAADLPALAARAEGQRDQVEDLQGRAIALL